MSWRWSRDWKDKPAIQRTVEKENSKQRNSLESSGERERQGSKVYQSQFIQKDADQF